MLFRFCFVLFCFVLFVRWFGLVWFGLVWWPFSLTLPDAFSFFFSSCQIVLFTDELKNLVLLTDPRKPKSFVFETDKPVLAKTTLERKKGGITVVYLTSPQVPLIRSFVKSALRQQEEDERALRIVKNLQRKRSNTDALDIQQRGRETATVLDGMLQTAEAEFSGGGGAAGASGTRKSSQVKYRTQKHISDNILKLVKEDGEDEFGLGGGGF